MNRPLAIVTKSLLCLPLIVLLTGCIDRSMSDLDQWLAEVKSRKAGHIEPLPEIKQIETFTYVKGKRRDPFLAFKEEESPAAAQIDNGIRPDLNRPREELEGYSLDALRMVGTLDQDGVIWALMRTKENTIHRVKSGNYMGMNHGQITRITESNIELTEIVPDIGGGFRERQASVALAQ